jgi:hypothetical protein
VAAAGFLSLDSLTLHGGVSVDDGSLTISQSLMESSADFSVSGIVVIVGSTLSFTGVYSGVATGGATGGAGLVVRSNGHIDITDTSLSFAAGVQTGLDVQSGGAATATGSTFTVAEETTVAVSIEEGGQFTVASSRLVGAGGSTTPYPCNGTLDTCALACIAPYDGPAVVVGMAGAAAPVVCDAATGVCLTDPHSDCNGRGTCAGSGVCTCAPFVVHRPTAALLPHRHLSAKVTGLAQKLQVDPRF